MLWECTMDRTDNDRSDTCWKLWYPPANYKMEQVYVSTKATHWGTAELEQVMIKRNKTILHLWL